MKRIIDLLLWRTGAFFYRRPKYREFMPDKMFLRHMFYERMGYKMNFNNPQTFNEKLQWLKLYDRNPVYHTLVDKVAVKQYIGNIIGEQYIIPTLGIYNSFDEIDFSRLPNRFVIKCTHDSGSVVVCKDKSNFDLKAAKRIIENGLNQNWYLLGREWPYKNVPRKIIIERYLENNMQGYSDDALTDYKFFCFNGEPRILYISQDKSADPRTDFFDMEFNHLPIRMQDKNSEKLPEKPDCLDEMKQLAAMLSKGIPHVRVDFYYADSKIYFGELTFFHCSGFSPVRPKEWNHILGDWIVLPRKRR